MHAKFGGSSAYRWLQCPGSIPLSENAPLQLTSEYAEEGTFAHALAEHCLLNSMVTADAMLDKEIQHPTVDSRKIVKQEMIDAVNVYLKAVWDEVDKDDGTYIFVEERFELSIPGAEGEVFGTNDALVFSTVTGKMTVFDYKHGAGKAVYAWDNPQLKFYATGACTAHPEWDVKSIEVVIVQPRCAAHDEDGGVDRWDMPIDELVDFPWSIEVAVKDAKSNTPTFKPGNQCDWCPAWELCTAREQHFIKEAALEVGEIGEITVNDLPYEDIRPDNAVQLQPFDVERAVRTLRAYDQILSPWMDQVRAKLDAMALAGKAVPGRKVVDKRASRKWLPGKEPELLETLELYGLPSEEAMPPKLLTITEMEKLLKGRLTASEFTGAKADLTVNFMSKESTGYTVVDESDKRPAVVPNSDMLGIEIDVEE